MEQEISRFLELLKIPISKRYVKNIIHSHPDFPTLLSISDTLERLGIEHSVGRLKKENLIDLPYPYLLPITTGKILVIKSRTDLINHEDELEFWSGVVLQAKSKTETRDKTNIAILNAEIQIRNYAIGLIAVLSILLFIPILYSFSWFLLALLITSIFGLIVGYFLVAKELGVSYKAIDSFCNVKENINCDKVLKADIKLFGVNFSDAVIIYFLFQIISLAFAVTLPEVTQTLLNALALISTFTIPTVLFSIYYQKFIVKTWCRLCLIIDILLSVQAIVFCYGYLNKIMLLSDLTVWHSMKLGLLFLATWFFIMLIKKIVEWINSMNKVEMGSNRVKHSITVFGELLMKQRRIDSTPFKDEMLVGRQDAPVKIIMVSNTHCNPCKKGHEIATQLVDMYPSKVSIAFRFVRIGYDTFKTEALLYLLTLWLQQIRGNADESKNTLKLIHDWYSTLDLDKFKKKYPSKIGNEMEAKDLETQHYTWINETGIPFTPTFFINGYQLPKEYSIDDLIAMIPGLSEYLLNINKR